MVAKFLSECPLTGKSTYELENGDRIDFSTDDVRQVGVKTLLRYHRIEQKIGRIDVIQHGRKVGTLPATFHPSAVRSNNFLYEPRRGDFTMRSDGKWKASRMLGSGDLEAVQGFTWEIDRD